MKTIGLIGGMSWESTVTYYQVINEAVKERLGGLHSARCVLYSVDFQEIEECQAAGEWERSGEILGEAAKSLQKAGADFIVICTNTMHKVAPQIQSKIDIPVLHIAEAAALRLKAENMDRVGLLDKKHSFARQLSGGQKQRVAIVRSLLMHPEIILFDEVTASLDPEMVREVLELINDLAQEGCTMLIVTHELQFARAIADRIIFMDKGVIAEEGTAEEFFNHPKTQRAQEFLNVFDFSQFGAYL